MIKNLINKYGKQCGMKRFQINAYDLEVSNSQLQFVLAPNSDHSTCLEQSLILSMKWVINQVWE